MQPNDIRASFLSYFEQHGHRIVSSSPLVPGDDPTLLFTNAGMNQFKDAFLGREVRDYRRATTAQKCMRVSGKHNDLDNVGPSLRHHTFFEMLGNFSFGDYFKQDAIELAWQLLTREWGLDPARLYVTIFKGAPGIPRDDEAHRRWRDFVPADHVGELGMADNFWAMGDTGPCGRCSEIYYDRGPVVPGTGDFITDVEAGSDRFVEIWNNVFMEFDRGADGVLAALPAPSIDTGMGLERIAAVMAGSISNYDTSLFVPVLDALGRQAGCQYGRTMEPADVSMRVVADHLRAMTFLIADGVVPSNEWRGYVLRKIMRRAMRHGRKLGLHEPFLHALVDVLVVEMGGAYPELKAGRDAVVQVVRAEEERFDAVLTGGLPRLEEVLERAARGNRVVPGDDAFKLYDTFGLPRDFMEDLAANQGLRFDADGFDKEMAGQRDKARAGANFKLVAAAFPAAPPELATQAGGEFRGYETTATSSRVMGLWTAEGEPLAQAAAGRDAYVVLDQTPFYLEAGGQVSDIGTLTQADLEARVTGLVRMPGWPRFHKVTVDRGVLVPGATVAAQVEAVRRDAIRRNHTATHVLHAALRTVLGGHVKQAGSLVAPDRLRFDFVHYNAVTPDELARVEHLVTSAVLRNEPVQTAVRDTQDAIASGAMALFGEKYGDKVRVVSIGDGSFSRELCGGTHVRATGDIGPFFITDESGVAAGVRRVEAVTGLGALAYARARIDAVRSVTTELNVKPDQLLEAMRAQQTVAAGLRKEVQQLKTKVALGSVGSGPAGDDRVEMGGTAFIARKVTDVDKESLRALADTLKSRETSAVIFLAAPMADGKVAMIASVTGDLTKKVSAGQLVKQLAPIVGGGGGGRPDFAEAGGKDPARIDEMLEAARPLVEALLTPR